MPDPSISVSEVRIRFANMSRDGLVGWASCVVNGGLFLNNITVYRNPDGTFRTEFPAKWGPGEKRYFHFCPINRETKRLLDDAILAHLRK